MKWVTVAVAASTVAFGVRHIYSPQQGSVRTASVTAKEDIQPSEVAVSFSAHTHQTKSGSIIQLQWDTSAKPIQSSSSGMLYIYDGVYVRKAPLQRHELELGSTNYVPETDEVTFHLVLLGGNVERQSLVVVLGAGKGTNAGLDER